ncbi:transposase domain-containing protein, partial [Rhizobium laguerreae]
RGEWKPFGRNTDASDNEPRLHRRHGQNERGMALNRKNALFAGSDAGAEHWATIASLIETAKLNDVEPLGYLADVLTKIVNGHPNSQLEELLPWSYRTDKMLPIEEQTWSMP